MPWYSARLQGWGNRVTSGLVVGDFRKVAHYPLDFGRIRVQEAFGESSSYRCLKDNRLSRGVSSVI